MSNIKCKKLNKQNIEDILPLTPLQEGMLFHYLKDESGCQYFEQLTLSLKGYIDNEKLKKAWEFVTVNNEMLRTVFRWGRLDAPIQIILKKYELGIFEYDFSELNNNEVKKRIDYIKLQDKKKGIDITELPWRITLCRTGGDSCEMIVSSHHILFDGWSNGIILKELFDAYNCYIDDKEPNRVVKTRFKEFIKWQLNRDKKISKKFWEDYLQCYETKTRLPRVKHNSNNRFEAKSYLCTVDTELSNKIFHFTSLNGITLAVLFYGIWGILLSKYNSTDDVLFGITLAERPPEVKGIEDVVGLFINTIPLWIRVCDDDSIIELLKKISKTCIKINEHENTPLVEIKSYSKFRKAEILFDSIIVIENYPIFSKDFGNYENKIKLISYSISEASNYDLSIYVEVIDNITLRLDYNGEVFDSNSIIKIAENFKHLLFEVLEKPCAKVKDIMILSHEEKSQILYDFNDTITEYSSNKTIQELFEEQADRTPDSVALVFEDKQLTYKELNKRANQLARVLKSRGAEPEGIIGLMTERSLEMIIGLLAVLKVGGAYLPIDPDYPKERISFMLGDSGSKLLLTQSHLIEKAGFEGQILDIDDYRNYDENSSNLPKVNYFNNLAYVIYTSGSTGKPKGTMIEHRSINNFIKGITDKIDFEDCKTVLCITTISFDIFVLETLLPLVKGLKVVVANKNQQIDPAALAEVVSNNKVDIMQTTPSRIKLLISSGDKNSLLCLGNLKLLLLGGEALPRTLLKELSEIKGVKIYNMYGPTETTVWSTVSDLTRKEEVNIGKPIANTFIYIVDKYNNPVPLGVPGEICIAGDGLARGYLGRPDLTEEKFTINPFKHGEKMYRTGDLGRWLPDGNIEFVGRIDFQIKIRGFRIEIGEIEYQILKYKGIEEAVVVVREHEEGDKYLCTYFVAKQEITVQEIREHLLKALPDYMIPSYFIQLEKMPLTPNLKIDRKALPEIESSLKTGSEYVPPSNEVEIELVNVWGNVLKLQNIGIDDDFFELGGNSLSLIKLHSFIDELYPNKLNVQDLFDNRTIRKQSSTIVKKASPEAITSKTTTRKITLRKG